MGRIAAAALLALPALLAFGRGGYFAVARLRGALLAWALVGVAALIAERPLPRSRAGVLTLGGLAALAAWTGLSVLWAPVAGPAFADFERLLLYVGAMVAGIALLRRVVWVEPAILATAVVASVYGLSERLLPWLVSLQRIASAGDRLAQPLTYWNAQGALAALGLVLAAGLAAEGRQRWVVAAAPLLGLDLYLTLSRGAIGAALAGLAVVVALAPTRAALRAVLVVGISAGLAAAAALALPGLQDVGGSSGQGALMIAILAVLGAAAAVAVRGADAPLPRVRPLAVAALAALLAGTVVAAATGGREGAARSTQADRLVSVQSNRYAYWKVAGAVFADHPLIGVGSGAFAVEWLKRRPFAEGVRDAHSLYLETPAELGLVGALALTAFVAGVVLAARRGPPAAVAAVVAFGLHAGLDWDWEMPALSLCALLLVARLVALRER